MSEFARENTLISDALNLGGDWTFRSILRTRQTLVSAITAVPLGIAALLSCFVIAATPTTARGDAISADLAAACIARHDQPREAAQCIDLTRRHVVSFSSFLVSTGLDNEVAHARALANAATSMRDYREFAMLMDVVIDTIDSMSRMGAAMDALAIWNDLCPSKFRALEAANCTIVTISGLRRLQPMLEAAR